MYDFRDTKSQRHVFELNGESLAIHKPRVLTGKATTKKGKKLQILRARGAFIYLPVLFSNDIVHGSWLD
jgi:hypothetical protein